MNSPTFDFMGTRTYRDYKLTSPLIGCRFDPSGRYLFAAAQDNGITRIDLATGEKAAFTGHKSWARGLAFIAPKPKASFNPFLWDAEQQLTHALGGGPAALGRPGPAVEPFRVLSVDYHGRLVVRPGTIDDPKQVIDVEAHTGWARAVATSPNGQMIATCGNDNHVKLWTPEGKLIKVLEGHQSHVYNVAFHPGGEFLVSGDLKGSIKIWDVAKQAVVREFDGKILHKYDAGFRADIGGIRGINFSPDGAFLLATGITNVSNAFAGVGNPIVLQYDWKDGKAKQLKPKEAFQGTGWGVAQHPSGVVINGGGGAQGMIWFWKGEEASAHAVKVPANVRDLDLHPTGLLIACACFDSVARIYQMTPAPAVPAKKDVPGKK